MLALPATLALAPRVPPPALQARCRHSFDEDLGPSIRGAIESAETTIRTDGLWSYKPLSQAGVRHERGVQGHGSRGPKLLPASHTVFYHLKSRLRGTFRGVSRKTWRAISRSSPSASITATRSAGSSSSPSGAPWADHPCPASV